MEVSRGLGDDEGDADRTGDAVCIGSRENDDRCGLRGWCAGNYAGREC